MPLGAHHYRIAVLERLAGGCCDLRLKQHKVKQQIPPR